jgi:hypothetical protein
VTAKVGRGTTEADLGDDTKAEADAIIARILTANGATRTAARDQ